MHVLLNNNKKSWEGKDLGQATHSLFATSFITSPSKPTVCHPMHNISTKKSLTASVPDVCLFKACLGSFPLWDPIFNISIKVLHSCLSLLLGIIISWLVMTVCSRLSHHLCSHLLLWMWKLWCLPDVQPLLHCIGKVRSLEPDLWCQLPPDGINFILLLFMSHPEHLGQSQVTHRPVFTLLICSCSFLSCDEFLGFWHWLCIIQGL